MNNKRYLMGPGGLVEFRDQAPKNADRRCPICGEVGAPDSRINPLLWFCDGCNSPYFCEVEGGRFSITEDDGTVTEWEVEW